MLFPDVSERVRFIERRLSGDGARVRADHSRSPARGVTGLLPTSPATSSTGPGGSAESQATGLTFLQFDNATLPSRPGRRGYLREQYGLKQYYNTFDLERGERHFGMRSEDVRAVHCEAADAFYVAKPKKSDEIKLSEVGQKDMPAMMDAMRKEADSITQTNWAMVPMAFEESDRVRVETPDRIVPTRFTAAGSQ